MPYQVFDCADGYMIIATGNNAQFQRLCDMLDLPDLATDPDYATNADRIAHRERLIGLLTRATLRRTKADLLAGCEARGIPAGPINDMAEVFADPQIAHRGLRMDLDGVPGVRPPFRFSDAAPKLDRPSPKLDEDGDAIRARLRKG